MATRVVDEQNPSGRNLPTLAGRHSKNAINPQLLELLCRSSMPSCRRKHNLPSIQLPLFLL
ncbi:hypothetical protein SETIT_2G398000v2 [Setaria italica]|uniref:Uncharacterized protein n=1 Tax=Setaria italica TaxID=4555 RepID=A0A368Q7T7_SETIT|nr:hypothetical protein SETIT_2G398000v2 [Setaria italica]